MILFWLTMAGGFALAFVGFKKGFLPIWAATFNTMVAIYLAVMLLPVYARYIPNPETESYYYSCAACMFVTAALTFAVLQPIASTYFSGGYAITFPRALDTVVAPALGFAAGCIATAFVILVISLMPFSAHKYVRTTLNEPNISPPVKSAVTTSCNIIGAASVQIYPRKAVDVLEEFSTRRTRFLDADNTAVAAYR